MSDFESVCTRARSLLLQQSFAEAERAYAQAVALRPASPDAQFMLAKVRYMLGDPRFARDLAAAAARSRNDSALMMQFADVLRLTGDLAGAELLLRDMLARLGPLPASRSTLASVLHELDRLEEAQTEAEAAARDEPNDPFAREVLVSILLSRGRAPDAIPHIREMRKRAPFDQIWIAHDATASRLTGASAYSDLYDYEQFIGVCDIEPPARWGSLAQFNAALEDRLRARHALSQRPFDQSMRSGTQTIGSLCDVEDDVIQAALAAFNKAIDEYRAKLASSDSHPFLARNRGHAAISTCWSVRLHAEGYHVNHIHPQGWLSSAYYVAVPTETADESTRSGWIKFGEPRHSVPGAGPALEIQPRQGMLVLFPSYMWHGTTAIHGNQPRMTMPFDVITGT
jgi:predicted Zn-dependent protease